MNPTISIIVPVYNVESYIRDCIDSIVSQDYRDYEIILVDDGSTDKSFIICEEYKARYGDLIVIVRQDNSGVSVARNTALANATGKWIMFLDSDDWFRDDLFDVLVPLLRDEVDIVQFGLSKVSPSDCYRRVPKGDSLYKSLDSYHITNSYIPGIAGYVIKRMIVTQNKISFSEGIKFSEDHEFIFKCFLCSKLIYVLPESLYFYRDREGSAVYHLSIDKAYGCIDVISNIEKFAKENKVKYTQFYNYWLEYSVRDVYRILASNKFYISSFILVYNYARVKTSVYKNGKIHFLCSVLYYKLYRSAINIYVRIKPLRSFWIFIRNVLKLK